MARKRKGMSVFDAMALIDDDMPDGAYWAMLGEMTGYGDDVHEAAIREADPPKPHKPCAGKGCKNIAPRKGSLCRACKGKTLTSPDGGRDGA